MKFLSEKFTLDLIQILKWQWGGGRLLFAPFQTLAIILLVQKNAQYIFIFKVYIHLVKVNTYVILQLHTGPANEATQFRPYSINDLGPSFVNQYILSGWHLVPTTMKGGNTRTMEIVLVLRRQISNIFIVTYLPTILMNIINQAINYITHDNKVSFRHSPTNDCKFPSLSMTWSWQLTSPAWWFLPQFISLFPLPSLEPQALSQWNRGFLST